MRGVARLQRRDLSIHHHQQLGNRARARHTCHLLSDISPARDPLQTRRLVHDCMRAAGRSLVRSIRRARESARAVEPPRSRSAFVWSRRRWSSSSFSRDGTRWAPHPFASLPSFAAGGLASLGLGATFALAGAASADASDPSAPQTAFGADVRVSSAALRDVSRDVADGPPRARRRALRLLSKITLYIDHHDAVLAVPEVRSALLEALRLGDAVDDQSRALVLGCLADLAKHPEIRAATILRRETLEALADAATPRRWRSSPPILARRAVSDATRLIAELAADDATHETLVASGVVDALARAAGISRWFPAWATMSPVAKRVVAHRQLVRVEDDEDVDDDESDAWNVDGASVVSANGKKVTWRGDSGASTSPYATLDALDRDVARHACAAWFGLAASNAGRAAIVASGATRTVVWHARSRRDRVAHRFAVGAAARSRRRQARSLRRGQRRRRSGRRRSGRRRGASSPGTDRRRVTPRGRCARRVRIRTYARRWRVGAPSETSFGFWRTPERDGQPTPRRVRRGKTRASRGRTKKPPSRRREG